MSLAAMIARCIDGQRRKLQLMTRIAPFRPTLASRYATAAALVIAFLLGPSGLSSFFHIDAALAKEWRETAARALGVAAVATRGKAATRAAAKEVAAARAMREKAALTGARGTAAREVPKGKVAARAAAKGIAVGAWEKAVAVGATRKAGGEAKGGSSSGGTGGRAQGAGEARGANQGRSLGAPGTTSFGNAKTVNSVTQDRVRLDGPNIQVLHRNGMTETVNGGRYEMKDARGRTIINRPATSQDRARLYAMKR